MLDLERINDYLTSDEASQLLGCSKRTLRRYSSQGLVSKVGRGKSTRYSLESIVFLKSSKSRTKFDMIHAQLASLANTQQLILTRLSLIESIFFSGPKADLSKDQMSHIKSAVKELLSQDIISFEECKDWSRDLIRLTKSSLLGIGRRDVLTLIDRLIINAETHLHSSPKHEDRLVVDRLRWVKSFVE